MIISVNFCAEFAAYLKSSLNLAVGLMYKES